MWLDVLRPLEFKLNRLVISRAVPPRARPIHIGLRARAAPVAYSIHSAGLAPTGHDAAP